MELGLQAMQVIVSNLAEETSLEEDGDLFIARPVTNMKVLDLRREGAMRDCEAICYSWTYTTKHCHLCSSMDSHAHARATVIVRTRVSRVNASCAFVCSKPHL